MEPRGVPIDTERVIAEVRTRPQIWLPLHALYKSRDARQLAWAEVARALVPNLDQLERADQYDIEKKIQQRWRTARDQFVKTRAQQLEGAAGGAGGRGYGYYEAMKFLEPTLRPPLKVHLSRTPPDLAPQPTPSPAVRRTRRRLRPRKVAHPVHPVCPTRSTPLAEDDDHFFASLAPMLCDLRTDQKLWFRSRVLALAQQLHAEEADEGAREEAQEDDPLVEVKYRPPSPDDDPLSH